MGFRCFWLRKEPTFHFSIAVLLTNQLLINIIKQKKINLNVYAQQLLLLFLAMNERLWNKRIRQIFPIRDSETRIFQFPFMLHRSVINRF
jgi:hypothetical protein